MKEEIKKDLDESRQCRLGRSKEEGTKSKRNEPQKYFKAEVVNPKLRNQT